MSTVEALLIIAAGPVAVASFCVVMMTVTGWVPPGSPGCERLRGSGSWSHPDVAEARRKEAETSR